MRYYKNRKYIKDVSEKEALSILLDYYDNVESIEDEKEKTQINNILTKLNKYEPNFKVKARTLLTSTNDNHKIKNQIFRLENFYIGFVDLPENEIFVCKLGHGSVYVRPEIESLKKLLEIMIEHLDEFYCPKDIETSLTTEDINLQLKELGYDEEFIKDARSAILKKHKIQDSYMTQEDKKHYLELKKTLENIKKGDELLLLKVIQGSSCIRKETPI